MKQTKSYCLHILCHGKEHVKSMSDHCLWFILWLNWKRFSSLHGNQLYLAADFTLSTKRPGNPSDVEAEVNDTETSCFCSTSCSTSKGDYLSRNKKANGEFYKPVRVCEPSPAKPGAVPESCYSQQSWGKRVAWSVPHRRGQGCDTGRMYIQSSNMLLLLLPLMKRVGMVHSSIWQGQGGGKGRQWTECRQSVTLRVWFNETTWTLSLLIDSASTFALVHWQLLPSFWRQMTVTSVFYLADTMDSCIHMDIIPLALVSPAAVSGFMSFPLLERIE